MSASPHSHATAPEPAALDLREKGVARDGVPQTSDRRLFMQLLVFQCSGEIGPADALKNLAQRLEQRGAAAVLYEDVNDPSGIGLLSWTEDPNEFVTRVRAAAADLVPNPLRVRNEFSMLGRSYSTGYEQDLAFWLIERPKQTVLNEAWPWAVWYPLRRRGEFERLEPRERGGILREHAEIGKAYGAADLAHDVRLACHGLDAADNEFVIGLIGKELHPLSHVVQAMRKTRQTAEYMAQMGPFFVGRAAWRSAGRPAP